MLTYTGSRNLYGDFTQNDNSTHLTLGDVYINEAIRRIFNSFNWDFLEGLATEATVASQENYALPADYKRMIGTPFITVSSRKITMQEAPTRKFFDDLSATATTGTIPIYFIIYDGEIRIYPIPSGINTMTYLYEKRHIDLNIADATNMRVTDLANGATTATVDTLAATNDMVGRYLQITRITASGGGDGLWYRIASRTSDTAIVLSREYQGTTLSSATAATVLGQVSLLPEAYQILPIYKAAEEYYVTKGNFGRADRYKNKYDELLAEMKQNHSFKTTNPVIEDISDFHHHNSNLFIEAS